VSAIPLASVAAVVVSHKRDINESVKEHTADEEDDEDDDDDEEEVWEEVPVDWLVFWD